MSFNVILVAPIHNPEERAAFLLFFISVKEHRVHVYYRVAVTGLASVIWCSVFDFVRDYRH